ncbi:hypothetical protein BT96DRAFT_156992 [Gymnopus androsaceus JB14]|uniref:Uncharacterized protein n=1 Tax=Gymnopus androsaceus JB14 TaxID=1447944 RepID=A0A6A4HDA3_9AGAR|nr:hypothetical protein BT96DRAFT_156992 [Gymnopus androsaceus JB14]
MNREFRFPPEPSTSPVTTEAVPAGRKSPPAALPVQQHQGDEAEDGEDEPSSLANRMITPSAIEVPPPPPVEKERSVSSGSHQSHDDGDDDVGFTEEVDLS